MYLLLLLMFSYYLKVYMTYTLNYLLLNRFKGNANKKLLTTNNYKSKYNSILNSNTDWWNNADEEVVTRSTGESYYDSNGLSLFDRIYKENNQFDKDAAKESDISSLSLTDISESYQFSLDFLADYVLQIGCTPPIDLDVKIGDILSGEQIYNLLEALNTLDPLECNIDFDSLTASDLAEQLGVSDETIQLICEKERFNLPFGMDTILHKAVVDKIESLYTYDDYKEDDFIDTEESFQ